MIDPFVAECRYSESLHLAALAHLWGVNRARALRETEPPIVLK